jgi:hypothetical protein
VSLRFSSFSALAILAVGAFTMATRAEAADYKVEPLNEKPPAELSEAVAKTLSPTGIRVSDAKGNPHCDLWLAAQWTVKADFKPSADHLYPFEVGQLLGAIRYAGKVEDFRKQPMTKGVYTVRYGLQPQDGNHVGTSDTRDFLVLIKSKDDTDAKAMVEETLFKKAAAAAGTTHPAMLALKRAGEKPAKLPGLRHDEEKELWIVQVVSMAKAGDKASELPLEIVVVGHAEE